MAAFPITAFLRRTKRTPELPSSAEPHGPAVLASRELRPLGSGRETGRAYPDLHREQSGPGGAGRAPRGLPVVQCGEACGMEGRDDSRPGRLTAGATFEGLPSDPS